MIAAVQALFLIFIIALHLNIYYNSLERKQGYGVSEQDISLLENERNAIWHLGSNATR